MLQHIAKESGTTSRQPSSPIALELSPEPATLLNDPITRLYSGRNLPFVALSRIAFIISALLQSFTPCKFTKIFIVLRRAKSVVSLRYFGPLAKCLFGELCIMIRIRRHDGQRLAHRTR